MLLGMLVKLIVLEVKPVANAYSFVKLWHCYVHYCLLAICYNMIKSLKKSDFIVNNILKVVLDRFDHTYT